MREGGCREQSNIYDTLIEKGEVIMILKWVLKKQNISVWSGFILFITGTARLNLEFHVVLCDNLKRQLHKTYWPPASITLLQLLCKHWHLHRSDCRKPLIYTHCQYLCHQPRLFKLTCI